MADELTSALSSYRDKRGNRKKRQTLMDDFIFGSLTGGGAEDFAPFAETGERVGEFIAEDPAAFGKGVAIAPFTAAPDIIGLAQQGANAAMSRASEELGLPGSFQMDPMSGDPIRELVGLSPQSGQGIAGEVVSPMATAGKGVVGAAKLLGGTVESVQAALKLSSGTDFPAHLATVLFHGSPFKFKLPSMDRVGSNTGLDAFGHGINLARSERTAGEYATGVQGSRYEMEVPEDVIARTIDWNAPLSEQPELRAIIEADPDAAAALRRAEGSFGELSGEDVHEMISQLDSGGMTRDTEFAADWFGSRGIPGVRYRTGAGDAVDDGGVTLFDPSGIRSVKRDGQLVYGKPEEGVTIMPSGDAQTLDDRVSKYLTEDEQALMTLGDRKAMDELLKITASPEEVASMAAAGGAKRGWYEESVKAIKHVFGDDSERFALLLAATSPQTSVESNMRNALNIWKNWDAAGRPQGRDQILRIMGDSVEGDKGIGSVLDAWVPNTLRALRGEADDLSKLPVALSGPKVNSFAKNLIGAFGEVTQDTWMARALGMNQKRDFEGRSLVAFQDELSKLGVKKSGYLAGNILVREAADIMSQATGSTWTPAQIQETVWSWAKAIREASGAAGETRSIPQLLQQGAVTDDIIRDVPDFATLFGNNAEFHGILEDAGYGKQLSTLPKSSFGAGGAVSLDAGSGGNLESAARRLDRGSRQRGTGTAEDLRQLVVQQFPGQGRAEAGVPGRFRRATRQSGVGVLKGEPVTQYALPRELQKQFNDLNVSTPAVYETGNSQKFFDAITESKAAHPFGAAVEIKDLSDYGDMRLFMTGDGTAGFAIAPDGDIVSVFNNTTGKHRGVTPYFLSLARENGGTKLDAFDINSGLPDLYRLAGFEESGRVTWDPQFRPDDWDEAVLGTPDVVFMEAQ